MSAQASVPRHASTASDEVVLTLDVDWAPDHVIDAVAAQLRAADVRATWFITHDSPAIDRLRAQPSHFELGVHPNFHPGSSHGAHEDDVLAYCAALVPGAPCVRTHGLLTSTRLLECLRAAGYRLDSSVLAWQSDGVRLQPHPLPGGSLWRAPIWWEDDLALLAPGATWDPAAPRHGASAGLRVLNFHPIHIALASGGEDAYAWLKERAPTLADASPALVASARSRSSVQDGRDVASAFSSALVHLAAAGGGATLSNAAARWCSPDDCAPDAPPDVPRDVLRKALRDTPRSTARGAAA